LRIAAAPEPLAGSASTSPDSRRGVAASSRRSARTRPFPKALTAARGFFGDVRLRVCDFGATMIRLSYDFDLDTPNKKNINSDHRPWRSVYKYKKSTTSPKES
jgi:hypothetical protein